MTDSPYTAEWYCRHYRDEGLSNDTRALGAAIALVLHPTSVIDIGCGPGVMLGAIERNTPLRWGLGIESPIYGAFQQQAKVAYLPTQCPYVTVDLERARAHDAATLPDSELVICTEVAEHLSSPAGDVLVQLATRSEEPPSRRPWYVVWTAAVPGQGGEGHVNEQPPIYWERRFAACGFYPHPCAHGILDWAGDLKHAPWYRNLRVFTRRK